MGEDWEQWKEVVAAHFFPEGKALNLSRSVLLAVYADMCFWVLCRD